MLPALSFTAARRLQTGEAVEVVALSATNGTWYCSSIGGSVINALRKLRLRKSGWKKLLWRLRRETEQSLPELRGIDFRFIEILPRLRRCT
jgi:hypothetical protein